MHAEGSKLAARAFGDDADSGLVVACQSHQDALRFLASALNSRYRVALLQGPGGAGKTTVVNQLRAATDSAVALVDAGDLLPRQFLTSLLAQYGVKLVAQQDDQLLQALANFASRESRSAKAPLLIVDNADRASPSVLSLLNWFAALEVSREYTMRIVLTGRERLAALARRDSLRDVARRHPPTWSMNPLTAYETQVYLRTRLQVAGGERADKVFPPDICERLCALAEGWPGALNRQALAVLERVEELKSARPVPRVILTRDGETIGVHELTRRKYVIGRSDLADIQVDDNYASKFHAMLQVYSNAILLSDLNSTNGTLLNSQEVRNTVLRNNDVIMLGRHRLKIENVPPLSREVSDRIKASDTLTLENLEELRKKRARRTIAALGR